MHDMRPIAIDDPVAKCVCQPVCRSVTQLRCVKTADRIKISFGLGAAGGDAKNIVLDEGLHPLRRGKMGWFVHY